MHQLLLLSSKRMGATLPLLILGATLIFGGYSAAQLSQSESELHKWYGAALGATSLTLLFVGATGLSRRLEVASYLGRQLGRLSSPSPEQSLRDLSAFESALPRDKTLSGWNNLVRIAKDRLVDHQIERREKVGANNPLHDQVVRSLRSLPEGIAITDKQGIVAYANPAWTILASGTSAQASTQERSIVDILRNQRFMNGAEVLEEALKGFVPLTLKLRMGKDLGDGVLQLTRNPLDGRLQDSEGFVWLLRDITQQSLANESHEQFLSSATHELRTPITNIRAYAESLLDMDDIPPAEQREFYNVITSEAQRLNRLLDELLNLQQLQAGSMTLSPGTFDCMRMLNEVIEQLQPLASEKGLKLVSRIAPNLKPIYADKEKLTACLVNLLGNAVKYTPEGEVRLIADQVPGCLVICVEDTGIGIASENIPKLFDRFFRCPDQRVQLIEGNGLGLAFAREVVELHNGQLSVESEIDQGSRFTIRIPLPTDA